MRLSPYQLMILFPLSTACETWQDGSAYRHAVFSEDGTAIAAIYTEFEEKNRVTHIAEQGHSSQVLMKAGLGSSAPTAITGLMEGAVRDLFFMRDEGYIILGRETDGVELENGSTERDIHYDLIELDGTVTSIAGGTHLTMLSCDGGTSATATAGPLNIIPSPDGTYLAKFEAESDCTSGSQTITFLDSSDLSIIDGPHAVPSVDMGPFSAPTEKGWLGDDVFTIGSWGMGDPDYIVGTQYTVLGAIEEGARAHMSCFYPRSSSSNTNADGMTVEIDEETGAISMSVEPGSSTYGCDA